MAGGAPVADPIDESSFMAGKRRKKKKKTAVAARSRDPFWRVRRAFGSARVASRKTYRRPSARLAARKQIDDA